MTGLERPVAAIVWDLRAYWGQGRAVRLSLTEKCLVRTVIGRVRSMAVTGAFVVVDGWQVPTDEILAVGRPTVEEEQSYRQERLGPEHFEPRLVSPEAKPQG